MTVMLGAATEKLDLRKELKPFYGPSAKEVSVVDVPPITFLMVDGEGDPNTAESYRQAVEALYSVSYTLKFMVKKSSIGIDYAVMPLEGLWWVEDMRLFSTDDKSDWQWTAMIAQPDFITETMFEEARRQAARKKDLLALPKMRFETVPEGMAAQIMHIGPYSAEGPNIEKLHSFIQESVHQLTGKHHEIYLSDPARTAPEKLKTVIRQPFE